MITSCENCGHRVIQTQYNEKLLVTHYGVSTRCLSAGCRCEKPE